MITAMDYTVGELATASGLSVDTIRYYQSRGLLDPPRREGRRGVYGDSHLQRLRRIRDLASQGLSLDVIGRLLESGADSVDGRLLQAVEAARSSRQLTLAELSAETGVPEALLRSAEAAGLWGAEAGPDGEARYDESDAELVRLGLAVLESGLPLDRLLAIATEHARNVEATVDKAIDLFNDAVRRSPDADVDAIVDTFTKLLPAATSLVALHFRRTLIAAGRTRLAREAAQSGGGAAAALATAIEGSSGPRLELRWG